MKVFTYSEAPQHLAKLLDLAREEEIEIRRRDGTRFSLTLKQPSTRSPFDIPGIDTAATTQDILDAIDASRAR
ncbi:MAG: prevent-host-death protein [Gammaproteobacteria bacterium]|jgi:hypothetical protein|nr:prevent-host-death protein [Gammaproteobacteria bacterium]